MEGEATGKGKRRGIANPHGPNLHGAKRNLEVQGKRAWEANVNGQTKTINDKPKSSIQR